MKKLYKIRTKIFKNFMKNKKCSCVLRKICKKKKFEEILKIFIEILKIIKKYLKVLIIFLLKLTKI